MPHRTAINDQNASRTLSEKEDVIRRYRAIDDLNGAPGRKPRADRIHVEADIRDDAAVTQAGGGA